MQDFRVRTAIPEIMGGLQTAMGARSDYMQRQAQQEKLAEGAQLLQTGTPEEIARWNMQNPELTKQFVQAANLKDQFTSKPRVQTAKDILAGRIGAREAYEQRLEEIEAQGGDAASLKAILAKSDEELDRMAKIDLAMMAPNAFEAYLKTQTKAGSSGFKMGTGDMTGYVFNEATGEFSIDPKIKAELDARAQEAANKAKAEEGFIDAKTRQGINKDITSLTKDVRDIHTAAASLGDLEKNATAAAKLAAVFKFMKALDPTSVVRETEQGQVYSAQGAARELAGFLNGLVGKGKLGEEGFQDIVNTAKVLANSAVDASSREVEDYLAAFEDTLPESFSKKLQDRVPSRFDGESTVLPSGVTEADIEFTMQKHGVTRDQVLERLRGR